MIHEQIIIRQLYEPKTSTYSYLLADQETRSAAIIDPVIDCFERDIKLIQELNLNLIYSIETHIHADHVTSMSRLRQATQCIGIVPYGSAAKNADKYMQHEEKIMLGSLPITALSTPGHVDKHNCYYIPGAVFTGDALFIRGCGRTDFQSGDAGTLYDSVTQILFRLPEDTVVYPGHDYNGRTISTIFEERKYNPRFQGQTRESFIQLMENRNIVCGDENLINKE